MPAIDRPGAWLETLDVSLGLFLVDKNVLPVGQLPPGEADMKAVAARAVTGEAASLAFLTLRARAKKVSDVTRPDAELVRTPLVAEAARVLGA